MARVPYSGVPETAPLPTPTDDYQHVQATPAQSGALIGQGLEQLGAGATHAARFFGDVAADNASNVYQERVDKILHGDPNKMVLGPDGQQHPDTGYLGLRGRQALDARPGVAKQFDDLMKETREGLQTPEQELKFDNFSRRYRSIAIDKVGSHADRESIVWYNAVNKDSATLAMTGIARNADNPEAVANYTRDLVDARIQQAQIAGAREGDPVWNEAYSGARRDALSAELEARAVSDPAGALRKLERNKEIAGLRYDDLANKFRVRANHQEGIGLGEQAYAKAQADAPAPIVPGQVPTLDQIHGAIIRQESGANPNVRTSINGAQGIGQILPGTFAQYAKPGERIENPADNLAVSKRIADDYYQRYGGDAQRVAVAYFSGPGNVAPAGSPTPWVRDIADGNGKTTSAYVGDVTRRLSGEGTAATKSDAYRIVMDSPASFEVKQAALAQINQISTVQQAAYVDQQRQFHLQEQQRKIRADKAIDEIIQDSTSLSPKITAQMVANDPRLRGRDKEYGVQLLERANKPDPIARTSAATSMDLLDRIRKPEGDPSKITDLDPIFDAYIKGAMTKSDFEFVKKQFNEGASSEGSNLQKLQKSFIAQAKESINLANMSGIMTGGPGAFSGYEFERYVTAKVQDYRKEGKDPIALFDPANKDYIGRPDESGRPAILKPFLKNMQQTTRDAAAEIPAKVVPAVDSVAERRRLDEWLRARGSPQLLAAPPQVPMSR